MEEGPCKGVERTTPASLRDARRLDGVESTSGIGASGTVGDTPFLVPPVERSNESGTRHPSGSFLRNNSDHVLVLSLSRR